MQMRHGLAPLGPIVENHPISVAQAFLLSQAGGHQQEVAQSRLVVCISFAYTRDGFARDHQEVSGGLWIDVANGNANLVLVDDVGGDFAGDDLFENRSFSHGTSSGDLD